MLRTKFASYSELFVATASQSLRGSGHQEVDMSCEASLYDQLIVACGNTPTATNRSSCEAGREDCLSFPLAFRVPTISAGVPASQDWLLQFQASLVVEASAQPFCGTPLCEREPPSRKGPMRAPNNTASISPSSAAACRSASCGDRRPRRCWLLCVPTLFLRCCCHNPSTRTPNL